MKIVEIISQVYQMTIRGANIVLLAEEELTLIDTGFRGSSSKIASFIHSLGRSAEEISLIIITHNHLDHAGGLSELREFSTARVAAHKADLVAPDSLVPYPRISRRLLRIPPFSILRPLSYAKWDDVDIPLEGGEVLRPLGGLRVIHTPGHTPGSICLFSPEKRLIFTGDAINNRHKDLRLPPKSVSTDLAQALNSIKQIARLDFDILCSGHGKPLTVDASVRVRELVKKHGG